MHNNEIKLLKKQITELQKNTVSKVKLKNFNFETIYKELEEILVNENCSFRYQNSNSKKNGHLKIQKNLQTNIFKIEIAIERKDDEVSKIYTFIHELTHLINHHHLKKDLTKNQKEIVADTTSKMIIKAFDFETDLQNSTISRKMNIKYYADIYLKNMQLSEKKRELIIKEIMDSYNLIISIFCNRGYLVER